MKKIILAVILAAGATFSANAQKVSFGVKGGLSLAKLTDFDRSKTRPSIYLGAYAKIGLDKNWAIQPELLYSGQGNKYEDVFRIDYTTKLGYINVPVMVQYHIVEEFFLEAGPQLGFLTGAHTKADKVSIDIKDDMKGVDFGLGFGLGYQFDMGLGVSARYMFGLSKVYDISNIDHKNSVAQIGVFYRIKGK